MAKRVKGSRKAKQGEMEGVMTEEAFAGRLTDLELLSRNDKTIGPFVGEAELLLCSVLQGKLDKDPNVRQEAETRTKRVLELMAAQICWTMFFLAKEESALSDGTSNDQ